MTDRPPREGARWIIPSAASEESTERDAESEALRQRLDEIERQNAALRQQLEAHHAPPSAQPSSLEAARQKYGRENVQKALEIVAEARVEVPGFGLFAESDEEIAIKWLRAIDNAVMDAAEAGEPISFKQQLDTSKDMLCQTARFMGARPLDDTVYLRIGNPATRLYINRKRGDFSTDRSFWRKGLVAALIMGAMAAVIRVVVSLFLITLVGFDQRVSILGYDAFLVWLITYLAAAFAVYHLFLRDFILYERHRAYDLYAYVALLTFVGMDFLFAGSVNDWWHANIAPLPNR